MTIIAGIERQRAEQDRVDSVISYGRMALLGLMVLGLAACGSGSKDTSYTVTPTAGAGGSISPTAGQTVTQGATTSFTVTPDAGYGIDTVSGCDGSLVGNIYTTGPITADCAVQASFNTPPGIPSLTLTPTAIKTFSFSWSDVAGERVYRLLENPDGISGYTRIATIAAGATSHDLEVFLPGRINARYILEACNSAGCTYSEAVYVSDTLAAAAGYVKASNTGEDDQFGYSVALSADGHTLAVGAEGEASNATGINGNQANNSANNSGAVYVFTRSGTDWSQQAYLKASNTGADDGFGWSVALAADGNTLAVGALREASNATGINGNQTNNSASNSGAVYVFTRSGADWSQQAYVKASNTGAGDWFGKSVALAGDGNTLAVGAKRESSDATGIDGDPSSNSATYSGAVYVFTRSGTDWSQQAYVKASNTGALHRFGRRVALAADGHTLAVGAYGVASNRGAVYVFTRSAGTWSQQASVQASNTSENDYFGYGLALAADGQTLAVGAVGESSNGNQFSGAVYVFTRSGVTWSQQAYLKASNPGAFDQFGDSVALSADGDTLAVGAWSESSNATGINGDQTDNSADQSGAVYVFTRSAGIWLQQAYVKAPNTGMYDYFGRSVALAGDGDTLAVGARGEGSNATGIGGDQANNSASSSGAVYLY